MSLTGKTINQLPNNTTYSPEIVIPVFYNGNTYKSTLETLEPVIKWKGLLTQTGPLTFTGASDPSLRGGLILNEIYTIDNFVSGDDFSNIAELLAGTMNTTDCVFRVTGDTSSAYLYPNSWGGSQITSDGELIVNVLENTLGTDLTFEYPADNNPSNEGVFRIIPNAGFFPSNLTFFNVTPGRSYIGGSSLAYVYCNVDLDSLTGLLFTRNFFTGSLEGYIINNLPLEILVYKPI
jgi:hypothetical protein